MFLNSLKWRIAAGYTLLTAVVLVAIFVVVFLRLQAILYANAQQRVNQTMNQIIYAAKPPVNPLIPFDQETGLDAIIKTGNIQNWSSPSIFVQIDAPNGANLAASSNLGGQRFAENPQLSAKNPGPLYRTVTNSAGPFLVEDQFLQMGAQQAIVHVAEPLNALYSTFNQTRNALLSILLGGILAVIALSVLLAQQITEPINLLARAMREMGSERLDRTFALQKRRDEIGQLAESFDDLLARLREAFARERQFISDASHELKTPLTSINANAQMLLRWGDRDAQIRRESLETIEHESGTLAGMVNGMLTLAKADRGDDIPKEPVSLRVLCTDVARAAAPRVAEKGLELRVLADQGEPLVMADELLLRQLVANLVDNAIKFTTTGSILLSTGRDRDVAWMQIDDSGPGIPSTELPFVFDRFYRADKSRSRDVPGTGLGLAIVRSIARVHGGRVSAGPSDLGGAAFRAEFPAIAHERFTQSS